MRVFAAALAVIGGHAAALLVAVVVAVGWAYVSSALNGVNPNAPTDPNANPPFTPVTSALAMTSLLWFGTGWFWWVTLLPALLLLPTSSLLWHPPVAAVVGGLLGVLVVLMLATGGGTAQLGALFTAQALPFWRDGLVIGATAWLVATLLKRWL